MNTVSKEAILKKHGIYPGFRSTYTYDGILAAMEMYASQFQDTDREYYKPVSVDDELPEVMTHYNCIIQPYSSNNLNDTDNCFYDSRLKYFSSQKGKVTHWLKKLNSDDGKQIEPLQKKKEKVEKLAEDIRIHLNSVGYALTPDTKSLIAQVIIVNSAKQPKYEMYPGDTKNC